MHINNTCIKYTYIQYLYITHKYIMNVPYLPVAPEKTF